MIKQRIVDAIEQWLAPLRLTSRIARRLFRAAFIVGVLGTVVLVVWEYTREYKRQLTQIENNFNIITEVISPALGSSIWDLDQEQIYLQIEELKHIPSLIEAQLHYDPNKTITTGSTVHSADTAEKTIQISYRDKQTQTTHHVGTLKLWYDTTAHRPLLLLSLAKKLLVNILIIMLIAFAVSIVFHTLITRRLVKITELLRNISSSDLHSPPPPTLKNAFVTDKDEVDELAGGIQFLWSTGYDTLKSFQISEQRWRFALDSANEGLWDWDLKNNCVFYSTNWKKNLGFSESEIHDHYDEWQTRLHPEDFVRFQAAIDKHTKGETDIYEDTQRLLCKDGSYKWFLSRGKIINRDPLGNPLRIIGTHSDITALKTAEQQIAMSALIYEEAQEGMMLVNHDMKILMVNPAFSQITGYSSEDIINLHPNILSSGRHDADFYKKMWSDVLHKEKWQGEIWNKRKDGTEYAEWLSITTIKDHNGKIARYIGIFSDITAKKVQDDLIWHQAHYDYLTALPNRQLYSELLYQEIKRSKRAKKDFWLMYLDLDRFKEVNDTLGHQIGDKLLVMTTQRLTSLLRQSDIVARLGGDEFAITLTDIKNVSHLDLIAETLVRELSKPFEIGEETVYISASIGIVHYPNDAETVDGLLKIADQAMYRVKHEGRNHFGYYTPSLQYDLIKRVEISNALREAVSQHQLELYYQPIVSPGNQSVLKVEALLRWHHPTLGDISPTKFIPIAEETGFINEIGDWVFETATDQICDWKQRLGKDIQISINKSPIQMYAQKHTKPAWIQRLKDKGLSGHHIIVEITEGLLLNMDQALINMFIQYKDAGIEVAIDDFGTGYSSLAYLNRLDIDYLKIDQSFINELDLNQSSQNAVPEAIIVMAHKLGLKVIAEGVETSQQMDILMAMGCNYIQGYLLAKPMPAKDYEQRFLCADVKN